MNEVISLLTGTGGTIVLGYFVVQALRQRIESLKEDYKTHEAKLEDAAKTILSLTAQLAEAKPRIKFLEQQNDELGARLAGRTEERNELRRQLNERGGGHV